MDRDRVEDHPPDVVLALVVGAVADPHWPGAPVAGEVVEGRLLELALAVDPVHDLQRPLGDRVGEEGEVLEGLPVEAEGEQRRAA